MILEWADSTSYSRGAPRIQDAWTAIVGPLRISVMTGHIYFRPNWAYLIQPLMHEAREIPGVAVADVEGAQTHAIAHARSLLLSYVETFNVLNESARR